MVIAAKKTIGKKNISIDVMTWWKIVAIALRSIAWKTLNCDLLGRPRPRHSSTTAAPSADDVSLKEEDDCNS